MFSRFFIERPIFATVVSLIIVIAGLVAMIGRVFFGLGASTNLTDGLPWGLWKVMNMVAGVCLATGGFLVACAVYVFRIEKYRPLARPASDPGRQALSLIHISEPTRPY